MPAWRSFPLRPNRSWAGSSWLEHGEEELILLAWASASASAAGVDFGAGADMVAEGSHRVWGCNLASAAAYSAAPIGASGRFPFRWCAAAL